MRFFDRLLGRNKAQVTAPEISAESEVPIALTATDIEHALACGMRSFFKERERYNRRRFWKHSSTLVVLLGLFGSYYLSSLDSGVKIDDRSYGKSLPGVSGGSGTGKVFFVKLEGGISGGYFGDQDQDNTVIYIKEALENALEEKHLAGIVLNIDSPGGGATASAQIYRILKKFRAEHKDIPLYSYVSDSAYSGGYYAALGTERIIADPEATVANIGVIISYHNTSRLGKLLGITEEEFATGPNKGIGGQWRPITKNNRKMILVNIDDKFEHFLNAVSDSRNIPIEDLRHEAKEPLGRTSGAWFPAEVALRRNLIDEIVPAEDFFALYAPKFAQKNKFKEIEYIRYQPKAALADKVSRRATKIGRSFFQGFLEEAKKDPGTLKMERN